jgi:voltage-gated potassium channel Kch
VENVFEIDDRSHPTRVLVLLLSTIVLIVVLPFSRDAPRLLDAVQIVMIASAVLVCGTSRRHLNIALALGIPAAVTGWIAGSPNTGVASWLESLFTVSLFFYVVALMLRRIFRSRVVTKETLYLAVSTYLLVGVVWTIFYIFLELLQPGSFRFPDHSMATTFSAELYYFSFVTMTTLGYGDVTPISPLAKSLAILEAVSGVMFLGILVARLLGRYQADSNGREDNDD